jgi:hypothetical protein
VLDCRSVALHVAALTLHASEVIYERINQQKPYMPQHIRPGLSPPSQLKLLIRKTPPYEP